MNHFSDIGFNVTNQEEDRQLFLTFFKGEGGPGRVWNLSEDVKYFMFKAGDIRYVAKLDDKNQSILNLSLAHDNKNISEAVFDKISSVDTNKEVGLDFPTIEVVKNDIPFWFSCVNYDLFKLTPKTDLQIKIASFADTFSLKEPTPKTEENTENKKEHSPEEVRQKAIENLNKNGLQLADEGYIAHWNENPCFALVNGVITDFELKENPITKNKYYSINADCLGLNFNFLVDPSIVDEKMLKVGNVASGYFWNTAILIDDYSKDLF